MGYHMQGAFYRAGLRALGLDCPPFTIIAVEFAAPHDVGVFELDDDFLWAGELLVAECMDLVAAGRFSNQWPGRYPEKRALSLPRWAKTEVEGEGLDGGIIIGSTGEAA